MVWVANGKSAKKYIYIIFKLYFISVYFMKEVINAAVKTETSSSHCGVQATFFLFFFVH